MMEEIIIQARIYKDQHDKADQPDVLIENIKDIEIITNIQKDRKTKFKEVFKKRKAPSIETNEGQLSLFN